MPYCAILIPQEKSSKPENSQLGFIQNIKGKLMSGLNTGGFNIDNATTLLGNVGDLLADNKDTILNKFSGIAVAQLLTTGSVSNQQALDYLFMGFPQALNQTAIVLGYSSIVQLKTALKAKNGVNVGQFIKSFENAASALKSFESAQTAKREVTGFDVIEVDATLADNRMYQSETPDRRVENGQSYNEFIHNLPNIFTIDCSIQHNRRHTRNEFEGILLNLRNRKIAFRLILDEDVKKDVILTNFMPSRVKDNNGLGFSAEFKQIKVGSVSLTSFVESAVFNLTSEISVPIIPNEIHQEDTKTIMSAALGNNLPKIMTQAANSTPKVESLW